MSLKSAIRILEVAERIDKEVAIETMRRLYHPKMQNIVGRVSVEVFDTIMPLLEALPDKEDK